MAQRFCSNFRDGLKGEAKRKLMETGDPPSPQENIEFPGLRAKYKLHRWSSPN